MQTYKLLIFLSTSGDSNANASETVLININSLGC